jgi:hypothetical protein
MAAWIVRETRRAAWEFGNDYSDCHSSATATNVGTEGMKWDRGAPRRVLDSATGSGEGRGLLEFAKLSAVPPGGSYPRQGVQAVSLPKGLDTVVWLCTRLLA